MTNFAVKAYCAGIPIFEKSVSRANLEKFMKETKETWQRGELRIIFGAGQSQPVSEVCLDVYDKKTAAYRFDLSRAFK
jgi:hypothetical protein